LQDISRTDIYRNSHTTSSITISCRFVLRQPNLRSIVIVIIIGIVGIGIVIVIVN
jgi:hypothetical protein